MNPTVDPHVGPHYKIKDCRYKRSEIRVIAPTVAAGEAVPWHLHPESDDYVICRRGDLQVSAFHPVKVATSARWSGISFQRNDRTRPSTLRRESANFSLFKVAP